MTGTRQGNPSPAHEERRRCLDAMAILSGHTYELPRLPDSRRPDVVRWDPEHDRLFIGDAKASETPGSAETVSRLQAYARWVATHVSQRGEIATFSVLFLHGTEARDWAKTVELVLAEAGVDVSAEVRRLSLGFTLVWALVKPLPDD